MKGNMIVKKIKISDIQPADYNPRLRGVIDEQLDKSLDEFGVLEPLVVNSREHADFTDHTPTIIGGHQRYYALQRRGDEEADVVWVNLDPIAEKKANLALNKITGAWDDKKLFDLMAEFEDAGIDIEATGFSEEETDKILRDISNEAGGEQEIDVEGIEEKKGEHLILDVAGCLNIPEAMEAYQPFCNKIAQLAEVTIVKFSHHKFEPQGITIFAILAESHISVHTYPEKAAVACDVYSCKEIANDGEIIK